MNWYLLLDADGKAVSYGTTLTDPLPANLTTRPLTDDEVAGVLGGTLIWDGQRFIPNPTTVAVEDAANAIGLTP